MTEASDQAAATEVRRGTGRDMLDVSQVAEVFGVSDRHIRRLVDRDHFPQPVRLGRLVRWPRHLVERWIDDGCPGHAGQQKRGRCSRS
jgi:excisionase family DNA binding protein